MWWGADIYKGNLLPAKPLLQMLFRLAFPKTGLFYLLVYLGNIRLEIAKEAFAGRRVKPTDSLMQMLLPFRVTWQTLGWECCVCTVICTPALSSPAVIQYHQVQLHLTLHQNLVLVLKC